MVEQSVNIFKLTEEELKTQYDLSLKSLNNYKDIDDYIENVLNDDRKKILEEMKGDNDSKKSQLLHDLKYANFCATREAKHKKLGIFKSTHKRPKF